MTAKRSKKVAAKHSPSKKKAAPTREGTKHAHVLSLLKALNGITVPDLAEAVGWQPHSVRGFLSGTVVKKLKLDLKKHRADGQPTRYSIAE